MPQQLPPMRPRLGSVFLTCQERPLLTTDRKSYPRQVRLINNTDGVSIVSPHLLERIALRLHKESAYKLDSFLDPEVFMAYAHEHKAYVDPDAYDHLKEDWEYVRHHRE
jgi:hypothetical protein